MLIVMLKVDLMVIATSLRAHLLEPRVATGALLRRSVGASHVSASANSLCATTIPPFWPIGEHRSSPIWRNAGSKLHPRKTFIVPTSVPSAFLGFEQHAGPRSTVASRRGAPQASRTQRRALAQPAPWPSQKRRSQRFQQRQVFRTASRGLS